MRLPRCTWALVCAIALAGPASADPLVGRWKLNLARSHYGPGAEPRKQETFVCEVDEKGLTCTIHSVRADGRTLVGTFTAAYDGRTYAARGIPEVDQVSLRKLDDFVADATFSYQGKPAFAYRAIKSTDGRHLIVVSVDPATRAVLNSVVVYDCQ